MILVILSLKKTFLLVATSVLRNCLPKYMFLICFYRSAMQGRPGRSSGANQGGTLGFSRLPWHDVVFFNFSKLKSDSSSHLFHFPLPATAFKLHLTWQSFKVVGCLKIARNAFYSYALRGAEHCMFKLSDKKSFFRVLITEFSSEVNCRSQLAM